MAMCLDTPPQAKLEFLGMRKYRQRNPIPKFTCERDQGIKMLGNSCIRVLYVNSIKISYG